MQSLAIFAAVAAYASADETCADETSMLQVAGQRKLNGVAKHGDSSDRRRIAAPLLHEGEQCWHADQCSGQGGSCPQYCGTSGVCCRAGRTFSDQEREECGPNGHGIEGMHTCQSPPPLDFHLAPGGAATCDHGTPLESSACLDAVTQLAANSGASLGRSALQQGSGGGCLDGSWGQVPGGCSAQSGGDWAAHYKSGSALGDDCVHAAYQLVCTGAPPTATEASCLGTYEAESATIVGAIVHANTRSRGHAGFTGDSFVDYLNRNDDYIEWSVPSCSGGGATASFRYALHSGDRPLQVLVNGQEVQDTPLSFPATGSWSSWSEVSVPIELTAGSNVVRLTATGRSGANMDSLIITAT